MEYQPLNKKAMKCMRSAALISAFVFALVFAGLFTSFFLFEAPSEVFTVLIILTAIYLLWTVLSVIILPVIRYKRYKYYISSDRVEVIEGLIFVHRSIVPVERIHQIMLEKGPLDSIYKLAKVKIITAGGQVVINLLEEEKANVIAENLKTLIDKKIKRDGAEINGLQ